MTPPLLKWRLSRMRAHPSDRVESTEPRPDQGWLLVDDGVVDLVGTPPSRFVLHLTLEAALAVAGGARPGAHLLDWIGEWSDAALRWDDDATKLLFAVLDGGDIRAWRFLETTGVLERALPELAEAVDRRRSDPFLLDPAQVLRFTLVDRIREVVSTDPMAAGEHEQLQHPEWLLLAALILDTVGEDASPVALARRIAQRLDLGAAAEQELALLVGDSNLLGAAARKFDGLEEARVYPIAIHLEQPERARALYVLTLALGDLTAWERERLDELHRLVMDLLDQPEVTGLEARNLVERRRAEALRIVGDDKYLADRIRHAPREYLLAQDGVAIARQAALVEPLPGRQDARVSVLPLEAGEWRIEVAARDRPGLLATVSGVIADLGLDILDATVATWPDLAALDSFHVRRAALNPARFGADELEKMPAPDPVALEASIVDAFDDPLESLPNPEADIRFDDQSSPWYTLFEVRCPDRRGLLHSLTAGIASAGASVHSAKLVTVNGQAVDRFELTDRNGRKLDDGAKDLVADAIRGGVVAKRRLLGRRR
jgi:[protein-PII] uridylyltransferase